MNNRMFLSILISALILGCSNFEQESISYLIPKGYQGVVIVVFDQDDGFPAEYEGNGRVYRIPVNGVLKTKFKPGKGSHKQSFFYCDSLGNRQEIEYFTAVELQNKKADRLTIVCYNRESGLGEDVETHKQKRFEVLLVSSIKSLDSIAETKNLIVDKIINNKPAMQSIYNR